MLTFVIVIICLVINALLSAAEMAFVSVTKPSLREKVRQGDKKAALLLKLRENPERTLSVVQIGITLVGAIAAAVGGTGAEELLSPYLKSHFHLSEHVADALSIVAAVIPITYLNVVLGELVPKTLAIRNSLALARLSAPWFMVFDRWLSPVVNLLEGSTKLILHTFFKKSGKRTEPEIHSDSTLDLDQLSAHQRQYVVNLVNIEKKHAKDIMLPWRDVVYVDRSMSFEEVEKIVIASGHTRLPVVTENKVMGIINTKEFMSFKFSSPSHDWTTIIRPILQLIETTPLTRALRLMQDRRSHLAAVVKDATIMGIITLEDIMEEIIGEIYDEDDDGVVKKLLSTSTKFRIGFRPRK